MRKLLARLCFLLFLILINLHLQPKIIQVRLYYRGYVLKLLIILLRRLNFRAHCIFGCRGVTKTYLRILTQMRLVTVLGLNLRNKRALRGKVTFGVSLKDNLLNLMLYIYFSFLQTPVERSVTIAIWSLKLLRLFHLLNFEIASLRLLKLKRGLVNWRLVNSQTSAVISFQLLFATLFIWLPKWALVRLTF